MSSLLERQLRPLVGAYLVVSAVANLLMVVVFGDLYRRYFTLRYQQGEVGATPLGDSVDGAMAVLLAVTVATALAFGILAALTIFRPRPWVLWVDAAALAIAGVPTAVGRLVEVFSPTHSSLPPVFGQTQLVLSLVAAVLALALAISLLRPPRSSTSALARPA